MINPDQKGDYKEKKPLTLDEFIQDGFLLKSLDLPAETCQSILGTGYGSMKAEGGHGQNLKIPVRKDPRAVLTIQERVDMVPVLSDHIIKELTTIQSLDQLPEKTI